MVLAAGAEAKPITVTAEPIDYFQRLLWTTEFGPFSWRGGLTLTSDVPDFGGFSGLVLGKDCESLLAVSDRGNWLEATLTFDGAKPAGLSDAAMSPILDSKGKPTRTKRWGDAEALTRLDNGEYAVGFESRVRFGSYDIAKDGLKARFTAMASPAAIDKGPENAEVEAFGQLSDGRLLAISERQYDAAGNPMAWAWRGGGATQFSIQRFGEYKVTDLAVDGDSILTLERRFSMDSLPGMAIRRFNASEIVEGGTVMPELLLEATAPLYVIDNMEAIAVCSRDGEKRVTVMSDDNFNTPVQSTILLQFAYRR